MEANERLGFKADHRDYQLPGAILKHFGISEVRLMSNNPEKINALERAGVRVTERVPCQVEVIATTEDYLRTKKEKLGHHSERLTFIVMKLCVFALLSAILFAEEAPKLRLPGDVVPVRYALDLNLIPARDRL